MRFRVSVEVDAQDADEAEAMVLLQGLAGAKMVRVVDMDLPLDRHDYMRHYVQPIEILDLAWNEYHEREAVEHFRPDPRPGQARPKVPSLSALGRGGVDPAGLSLLFDLAITAYVQSLSPSNGLHPRPPGFPHRR